MRSRAAIPVARQGRRRGSLRGFTSEPLRRKDEGRRFQAEAHTLSTRDTTMPSSSRQDKMRYLCRHYGMSNLILTNATGYNALMPLFMCAFCHADLLLTPIGPLPGNLACLYHPASRLSFQKPFGFCALILRKSSLQFDIGNKQLFKKLFGMFDGEAGSAPRSLEETWAFARGGDSEGARNLSASDVSPHARSRRSRLSVRANFASRP